VLLEVCSSRPRSVRDTVEGEVRVLVVEDHAGLAKNVARALREAAGYAVDISLDGQDGLFMAQSNCYDLIVLDLMLPKLDGLAVLKKLRAGENLAPVLILTSRDDKETTVSLLETGADDYLTKPFEVREMVARCRALIRRAHGRATQLIEVGDLVIHPEEMTAMRAARPLKLTAMEYRLLEYMAHRPRAVLSKNELLEHLYDHSWEKFSNVLEVYISSLRRKLNVDTESPLIFTHKGLGYSLTQSLNL
jgi:DNA-binding response OmpR family regulator